MSFGLNNTVARVLNQALGNFLEDIDKNQLDLNLFSGKVALRDISVKSSVFDNFPIPFKLVYGKVGKIDLDVPVMSIFSSPLKIKIEDVFVLVKPMETSEWNEDKEVEHFKRAVETQLSNLEEYFTSTEEIEKNDPGMLNKMLSNIVDNLQISVSNICIRYEDELSNPSMPFCLGLTIKELSTFTANDKWEKEFITKQDVSNKSILLDNFSLYLNFKDQVFYEDLTKEFDLDQVSYKIKNKFKEKKGKDRETSFDILKYKHFISAENQATLKNSYLIYNFCIESHVKLNKNPKANAQPQLDLNLVLGGKFKRGTDELSDSSEELVDVRFQQQQLIAILKFLEYSGYYTKFQAQVCDKFYSNDFTKEESETYIEAYVKYRHHLDDVKTKKAKQFNEGYMDVLKSIESDDGKSFHTYEQIAGLRNAGFNKYQMAKNKEREREEIDKKVAEKSKSKQGVMNSMKGFFGFSNQKDKQKDEEEVKKYQEELDQEFIKKYQIEEQKLNEEIEDFLNNKGTFDDEIIQEMSPSWVRFKFKVCLPQYRVALLHKDCPPTNNIDEINDKTITALSVLGMYTTVVLSRETTDIQFGFKQSSIHVGANPEEYMLQTVRHDESDAIEARLTSSKKEGVVPLTISAKTNCETRVFMNIPCIKDIEMFFTGHLRNNKIDLTYYAEQAKIQFLKYINLGIDYYENFDTDQIQSFKMDLNLSLASPILFIKDPRAYVNKWLLLN